MPRATLPELAYDALIKMGVEPKLGKAQAEYAEGRTKHVPVHTAFNTGKRRISRKLTVGLQTVKYENDL